MQNYTAEQWRRLGAFIRQQRTKAGWGDMKEWSSRVGRSSRVLLGLERGETVGAKTLDAIADVLGWSTDVFFDAIERGTAPPHGPMPRNVRQEMDSQDVWRDSAEGKAHYDAEAEALERMARDGESIASVVRRSPLEVLLAEIARRTSATGANPQVDITWSNVHAIGVARSDEPAAEPQEAPRKAARRDRNKAVETNRGDQ